MSLSSKTLVDVKNSFSVSANLNSAVLASKSALSKASKSPKFETHDPTEYNSK